MNEIIDPHSTDSHAATPVREFSPSQAYNMGHYAATAVIALGSMAATAMGYWPLWIEAILLVAMVGSACWRYIKIATIKYKIDPQRLTWSQGVFSRDTGSLELVRVQNVLLHQSLWERLVGVGQIHLETLDRTNPSVYLIAMPKPEEFREWLTSYVQHVRQVKGYREQVVI